MVDRPIASIIILTYNNLDLTRSCIESIYAKTDYPFEPIVVDNASSDNSPQYLSEFGKRKENIKVILNHQNQGFAKGNNQGAYVAKGKYLVFLNNDTIVTKGWLTGLINHLGEPDIGMVGPVTNSAGNEARINVEYEDIQEMDNFAKQYTDKHMGQTFEIRMLALFCVVIRRSVWEEVGPLDERFGIGMFEDDDYAIRIKAKGYKILCAEDVFIHHWGSASFSKWQLIQYWEQFSQNREKFEQKWGMKWQPHMYRPDLIKQQVNQQVESSLWYLSLLAKEQANRKALEYQLNEYHKSRLWKLSQLFQRPYFRIPPPYSIEDKSTKNNYQNQGNPAKRLPIKERIRNWANQHRMSWFAYSFDQFKRNRNSLYSSDFSSIECPSKKDRVSIVLPVFNGEAYITEAINSILAQTYSNFELIIVNDGSTDDTPKIIESYSSLDPHIRIIHQENQNLPRALSNGFIHAKGEFLTWISADNRLKPDFLEKLISCLRQNPTWDMVYANEDIIDQNGNPLINSDWFKGYQEPPGSEHVMLPDDPSELNTYPNNYIGGAFMYRDRVDYLIGDYSQWRFGIEDYDYWMKVNALMNIHHLDARSPIYDYRFHSDSLTSRDEELGITRDRIKTMIYDNFRRDFYLSPLIWKIHSPGNNHNLLQSINEWISSRGHIIYDEVVANPDKLPALWCPVLSIQLSTNPSQPISSSENLLDNDLKVLIVDPNNQEPLPEKIDQSWDFSIKNSHNNKLPRLEKQRQGWLSIPSIDALCTAIDIKAKITHLSQIESRVENPENSLYKISVIICTYHRGPMLMETLKSIAQQSFPREDYELIIVNNDPMDTLVDDLVAHLEQNEFKDRTDRLKIVHCPIKGLSFARNAGISEANGIVVSFIDDDAIATPDWLRNIWLAFQMDPNAGVVGGFIRLKIPKPRPRWLKPGWEKYWSQFLPEIDQLTHVNVWWKYPWGANWSAKRQALFEIGGFRGQYGRKGRDFGGAEEIIAASLIQQLGYNVLIHPDAEVIHNPNENRYSLNHVWQTIKTSKKNYYNLQLDLYIPKEYSPRLFLKNILQYTRLALLTRKLGLHQRFEYIVNACLEFSLIWRWSLDQIARFRKTAVLQS